MKYFRIRSIPYVLMVFVTSLIFFGCENFLDPDPETFDTKENFFNSEDEFLLSLNASYARLQDWVLSSHVLEESRSDNTTYDNQLNLGVSQHLARVDWFIPNTDIPQVSTAWDKIFRGIKESNVPLSVINEAIAEGKISEDFAATIEAELKFIRAFFYFTAVKLWGDVPLVLEPITNGLSAFEIVRRPNSEVLDFIIKDLENAVQDFPENYDNSNSGRMTKHAARTLLAKIYLWNGEYGLAEQNLREILNSGTFSLNPNYAQIFDPDNKFNSEIIAEVGFKEGGEDESSNFLYQFVPVGSFPAIIPTLVNDGTWGKNLPTRDLVSSYEPNDERFEASIGFFSRSDTDSIPYIKKWDEATDPNFARTNHNWPLYRYADVILMLAEAINEQGYDSDEPFMLINQVRHRAGLSPLSVAELPDQAAFREALIHERRIELAFENHRWYDLLRYDKAIDVMKAHGTTEIVNPATARTSIHPLDPRAYEIEPYMLLYPIPQNELITNPNMTQNPGY